MPDQKTKTREDGSVLVQPGSIEGEMLSLVLPDGRNFGVTQQLFNSVIRLSRSVDAETWEEEWTYEDCGMATVALLAWDWQKDVEPDNWIRHVPTMRRRAGGDPALETCDYKHYTKMETLFAYVAIDKYGYGMIVRHRNTGESMQNVDRTMLELMIKAFNADILEDLPGAKFEIREFRAVNLDEAC